MSKIIVTDAGRSNLQSLEPAIDPNARPTFLLDWEITLKCNLDCSYCPDTPEMDGGHWTLANHPPLEECLRTIDFMFEYVDLYMKHKAKWTRAVVLNLYGGESLLHPDIVEILKAVKDKYQAYKDSWPLTITCTTNATLGTKRFSEVCEYIDGFTFSYHCESLDKHKETYRKNVLLAKEKGKQIKCIVLMHADQTYWPELLDVIEFCKQNQVQYLPRQLDGDINSNYNAEQVEWFKNLYVSISPEKSQQAQSAVVDDEKLSGETVNLADTGRACCGGRLVCTNQDLKNPMFYVVGNNFKDWHCSVNWMFLFVKQNDGRIYSNKDCRMNFDGTVSPIGHLEQSQKLINWTRERLENKDMPVIQCQKTRCVCGICAPKALTRSMFDDIIKKHIPQDVFEK